MPPATSFASLAAVRLLLELQVVDFHSEELSKVVEEAERSESAAYGHVAAAAAAVQRARRALAVQEKLAGRYQDSVLHLQELTLAVRFEQMSNKERGQRHQAIDEVCSRVVRLHVRDGGAV